MSEIIFAVSTSSPKGSVCVYKDGCYYVREFGMGLMSHSAEIIPALKSVFDEPGISVSDVNCALFDAGPGSFTGIRVGYVTLEGLFFNTEAKRIAFSSLDAIACSVFEKNKEETDENYRVLIDAGRNEYYVSVYSFTRLKRETDEKLVKFDDLKRYSYKKCYGYLNRKNKNEYLKNNIVEIYPSAYYLVNLYLNGFESKPYIPHYVRKPNIIMKKR